MSFCVRLYHDPLNCRSSRAVNVMMKAKVPSKMDLRHDTILTSTAISTSPRKATSGMRLSAMRIYSWMVLRILTFPCLHCQRYTCPSIVTMSIVMVTFGRVCLIIDTGLVGA